MASIDQVSAEIEAIHWAQIAIGLAREASDAYTDGRLPLREALYRIYLAADAGKRAVGSRFPFLDERAVAA